MHPKSPHLSSREPPTHHGEKQPPLVADYAHKQIAGNPTTGKILATSNIGACCVNVRTRVLNDGFNRRYPGFSQLPTPAPLDAATEQSRNPATILLTP